MLDRSTIERLLNLWTQAIPRPWRWSENGNILGHMPDGYDETREVGTIYTERDDDLVPINAEAIIEVANAIEELCRVYLAVLDNVLGWQPIESAPRDGKLFLGWVSAERWSQEDGGGSGIAHDTSEHDFCRWREMETGGFYENMMGQIGDAQDITHWMPLPPPPIAAAPLAGEG